LAELTSKRPSCQDTAIAAGPAKGAPAALTIAAITDKKTYPLFEPNIRFSLTKEVSVRNQEAEARARQAAAYIRQKLSLTEEVRIGVILGTGWGDTLKLENVQEIDFAEIPGFEKMPPAIEGHARKLVYGTVAGRPVLALKGRLHVNEDPVGERQYPLVRLQVEMLLQLGVYVLILTCAAGGLAGRVDVGDIVIIDGFVTLFAPTMPLYGGEFCSPEDALNRKLARIAFDLGEEDGIKTGGHVMLRGPFFEGRKYDKCNLARTGASVVGMSVLPEACVAALYDGVHVLALAFVTNDDVEEHSHDDNQRAAKAAAAKLSGYLTKVIGKLPL